MSLPTEKFDVGGTVFKVSVSTIQNHPEGLLAKMIDGRLPCGKDQSGAYFIDRNPEYFNMVLDVHRDNKVYPLSPGMTRERVVAELEFYGLQDFQGDGESSVRGIFDWSMWQHEQQRIGQELLTEGVARVLISRAEQVPVPTGATLKITSLDFSLMWQPHHNQIQNANIRTNIFQNKIVELFGQWNFKATMEGGNPSYALIKLEPAKPAASADAEPDASSA